MGREIYCSIIDKENNELWNSADENGDFVCGRDDATTYLASLADPESCLIDITDEKTFKSIKTQLEKYRDKDDRELNRADRELEDLSIARRNARNYEEFCSFAKGFEAVERWIEENQYSRAYHILNMIDSAQRVLYSRFPDAILCIVVSE